MIYRPKNFELNKAVEFISDSTILIRNGDSAINENNMEVNLYGNKKRQIDIWIYTAGTKEELSHGPRLKVILPGIQASYALDNRTAKININKSSYSRIPDNMEGDIRKTVQALAYFDFPTILKCHKGEIDNRIKDKVLKDMSDRFNRLSKSEVRALLSTGGDKYK